jgi:hypothetical protein
MPITNYWIICGTGSDSGRLITAELLQRPCSFPRLFNKKNLPVPNGVPWELRSHWSALNLPRYLAYKVKGRKILATICLITHLFDAFEPKPLLSATQGRVSDPCVWI